ncbi:hypothetical protein AB0M47_14585 [Hamadaea sp. NPDC051192]|uniref:hypothetical protein n=1 Tax=Hamadaea sp. NPDC051192 TaxID=3154940 RepID=UPI0034328A8A
MNADKVRRRLVLGALALVLGGVLAAPNIASADDFEWGAGSTEPASAVTHADDLPSMQALGDFEWG